MTRDELIDLVATTLVKTDVFLTAHGKEYVVRTIRDDPSCTEEELRKVILKNIDNVEKYNPHFDRKHLRE